MVDHPGSSSGTVREAVGRCRESVRILRWLGQPFQGLPVHFFRAPEERSRRADGRRAGGKQSAEQPHDDRVNQRLPEQRRRDGKREGHLAERLEVHGRGLVAVEGQPTPPGRRSAPPIRLRNDRLRQHGEHDGEAAESERAQRGDLAGRGWRRRCTSCSRRRRSRRSPSAPR